MKLLTRIGVRVTSRVRYFLHKRQAKRQIRVQKLKNQDVRKKRNQRKFDKLKKDTATARKERAKQEGTYKPGYNMNGGDDSDDNNDRQPTKKKAKLYKNST